MAMKVRLLFSDSSPLLFSIKVAREIKSIRQELDAIKSDMDGLNMSVCDHRDDFHLPFANLMSKRETTSFVQPDDIIGRHDDKNAIISMIFDPVFTEERVSVIPIVGFGGIGKTSLAQLVFNDEKVKTHFELMKWACVPEVDNQFEVMRKICNSLTGLNSHGLSLEQVQSKIRESISNKRYLLVLDDIWDESRDRWLQLKSLLDCGCKGSKIIVTARSNVVANVVGTCPAYDLGLLTDEESWELFKRLALKEGQEESNPNFTRIGKDIVGRCGRVPLAIRVIGSLLYSKDTEQEWLLFRDGHLAKTKVTEDDNIMPILKLSYDFLPSPLKQCFAYCSLFQKDYEFEKNELLHLWMAQGYIEASKESIGLEEVGDLYFLELLRRNFFQDALVDDKQILYLEKCMTSLHVASDEGPSSSFLSEYIIEELDSMKTISRLESLRALKLTTICRTLPDCIGRLRHLRYLNLRYSSIKCLPDAITKLENLQTLNLYKCSNLEQLPNGFTKLANLRHLGISKCFILREMPSGFEKMRPLRGLNTFMVGKNSGVDALATLELRGNLEIRFHIWRRNTVLEARRVKLERQEQLTGLTLAQKGDCLQLMSISVILILPRVEHLSFEMIDEKQLESLLASHREAPSPSSSSVTPSTLKTLAINQIYNLVSFSINLCSLESLSIRSCEELTNLIMVSPRSSIRVLNIDNCDSLRNIYDVLQNLPALEELSISSCEELDLRDTRTWPDLRSLYFLEVSHISKLQVLPSAIGSLQALRELKTIYLDNLTSLPEEIGRLSQLQQLVIYGCQKLASLPQSLRSLSSLQQLSISNCPQLETRCQQPNGEDWPLIQHIPNIVIY